MNVSKLSTSVASNSSVGCSSCCFSSSESELRDLIPCVESHTWKNLEIQTGLLRSAVFASCSSCRSPVHSCLIHLHLECVPGQALWISRLCLFPLHCEDCPLHGTRIACRSDASLEFLKECAEESSVDCVRFLRHQEIVVDSCNVKHMSCQ